MNRYANDVFLSRIVKIQLYYAYLRIYRTKSVFYVHKIIGSAGESTDHPPPMLSHAPPANKKTASSARLRLHASSARIEEHGQHRFPRHCLATILGILSATHRKMFATDRRNSASEDRGFECIKHPQYTNHCHQPTRQHLFSRHHDNICACCGPHTRCQALELERGEQGREET